MHFALTPHSCSIMLLNVAAFVHQHMTMYVVHPGVSPSLTHMRR